jgi:hypothetical protein
MSINIAPRSRQIVPSQCTAATISGALVYLLCHLKGVLTRPRSCSFSGQYCPQLSCFIKKNECEAIVS